MDIRCLTFRSSGYCIARKPYFCTGMFNDLLTFSFCRGHYDMLYKVEDTIANPIQSEDSVFVGLATPGDGYKATATGIYGLIPGMSAPKPLNDLSSKPLVNQVPHMIQCQREPMELFAPLHQAATPTYNMSTLSALSSPQQNSKGPFRSSKYENGPGLASINCQNLQTKPLLE